MTKATKEARSRLELTKYLFQIKMKAEYNILGPKAVQPYQCSIKLTENCQSRCITCNYWKNKYEDLITTERAIKLLNEDLPEAGINSLRFTGGEPLLRKDFFEILSALNTDLYNDIILQTNGLLLRRYAKEINDSPITNICVSLDGLADTNDRIRGIKGGFNMIIEGLSHISRKKITVVSTLHNRLGKEIEQLITFFKERGYGWDINLPDSNMYFFKGLDLVDISTMTGEEIDRIVFLLAKYGNYSPKTLSYIKNYLEKSPHKKENSNAFRCYLGFITTYINSTGDLLSGCYVMKPMGNILAKSVKEIISTDDYEKRVMMMLSKKCPGCTCGFKLNMTLDNLYDSLYFRSYKKLKRLVSM